MPSAKRGWGLGEMIDDWIGDDHTREMAISLVAVIAVLSFILWIAFIFGTSTAMTPLEHTVRGLQDYPMEELVTIAWAQGYNVTRDGMVTMGGGAQLNISELAPCDSPMACVPAKKSADIPEDLRDDYDEWYVPLED